MSGASERANGRASGPVLQSVFLAVLAVLAVLNIVYGDPEALELMLLGKLGKLLFINCKQNPD